MKALHGPWRAALGHFVKLLRRILPQFFAAHFGVTNRAMSHAKNRVHYRMQILKEDLMALQDDINTLIADYEAKLAAAGNSADLQAQLDKANADLAQAEADKAALQGQIDQAETTVQAKIAELTPPTA